MRVKHQVRNLKYMYTKQETLQVFMFMHVQKQKTKCILVKQICSKADQSDHLCQANAFVHTGNYLNHYHGYFFHRAILYSKKTVNISWGCTTGLLDIRSRHTLFKRKERTDFFPPYCDGCSTMTLPKLPWSGGSPVNLHPNCITNGRPVKFSMATSSFTPTEGSALKRCDSSLKEINSVQYVFKCQPICT